ncbi:G2-specific serine/threonine protein kinase [Coniosporium tulheliwenetii]|uniref:G2-specific serine/threonine protein kinase n=1 Tax=Coniosporium tulheliwenetii TaxID=3383036 RepID=A0ACC2YJI7_9PEZI|nr:G2-specific serine/threonine protein kinase [Cladosporium sp. JES 115]
MTEEEKYEVLEKIGHGSFGVIRKVRRKSDGYVLCRKEISYVRMSQKEKEQLQAELSILKELRHPNIVAYYERDHLKGTQDLHLYMEYCGNGDLGRVIKNLTLKNQFAEEEFVWSIFSQLVTALYRCHYGEDPPEVGRHIMGLGNNAKPLKSKQGHYMILHRDLKPENVFLDADNSVKLGDFGLSKILQSHDFASTYVGTPFYMSPEICAAEKYTLYSDIWSLGCIIYELCAKAPPFNARTHFELIQKIKAGKVAPLPPVYSQELQKVISSCLKVNPNSRPDTAQLLNLPIVKLMRKEQEVVQLGQQMKLEKELASKTLKEANDRMVTLEKEEALRLELDASVRREWEVKARLEIDRQVQIEFDRLRKTFEAEVSKRVAEELIKHPIAAVPTPPTSSRHSSSGSQTLIASSEAGDDLPRSSTPTLPDQQPHHHRQLSEADPSDNPSSTDLSALSNLSMESPFLSKKPLKKSTRTPFTRAKTMWGPTAVAPSPMDIHMAEPSPISIACLSLSPRRQASGTGPTESAAGVGKLYPQLRTSRNIFAAAAAGTALAPLETVPPLSPTPSSFPSPHSSDAELDPDFTASDVEESDEDVVPDLPPSPTRKDSGNTNNDPFKVLAAAPGPTRPGLSRQRTLPQRLGTAPSLFPAQPLTAGKAALAHARPSSAVPVVATSPSRARKGRGMGVEPASPTRKVGAVKDVNVGAGAGGHVGGAATAAGGLKSKKGNDEMLRTAMRNQGQALLLQGRTLVELQQATSNASSGTGRPVSSGSTDPVAPRPGSREGTAVVKPGTSAVDFAVKAVERDRSRERREDVPMWDPERDEMPSPFLVKTTGRIRAGGR